MPKLKNVTPEEWKSALDKAEEALHALQDVTDRIEKGYVEELPDLIAAARTLNALVRTASSGVSCALTKAHLQEQKREIEAMLRDRTNG